MAYVGTPIEVGNQFSSLVGKRFSGDASTTAFTLDVRANSALDIEVFVENVRQDPNSAYTVNGTTLTFTAAPPSGTNNIYVVHQAPTVASVSPTAGSVTASSFDNSVISGHTALAETPASTDEFLVSDAGTIKRIDFSHIQGVYESQLLHVRDEKSTGSAGGDASATTDNVRVLNTVVTNEISGASLGSNRITLPAGTYFIDAWAYAYQTDMNRAMLYNQSDSSVTILGHSNFSDDNNQGYSPSFVRGRFTISAQKLFEIRHYTEKANSGNGFGIDTDDSRTNVYTDVLIWKVA
jgi:hypothetical protein